MSKFMTRQLFPPFITGVLMTINFALFWALPVAGMGVMYKTFLRDRILPIYNYLESNRLVRSFASTFIYSKEKYADYFVLSFALLIQCAFTIPLLFYWQLTYGYLPAWMIAWYYCTWVGFGGSGMGTAYALAHKEGHDRQFYKPWVSTVFGNIFENGLGLFFGNIPWNFTTSHCKIHHATNGGMGDTFYEWDFVRCDPGYFMIYVTRILLHTTGYSSLRFLYANGEKEIADQLMTGVYKYVSAAVVILAITRSPSFLFWVYVQPFLCMTYFLALINIGFHGFIEFDENGKTIPCVDSTAIVDGEDDFFGEDDHMTHHYNINVYFKDLPEHQRKQHEEWAKYHASVFKKISIMELSIYIIFGLWEKLADHYVDISGKLTRQQIIDMLKVRANRVEMSFENYQRFLDDPKLSKRDMFRHRPTAGKGKDGSESPSELVADEKKSG